MNFEPLQVPAIHKIDVASLPALQPPTTDWVEQESPEGIVMWKLLADHPLNTGLTNPYTAYNADEAWQYMGTEIKAGVREHSFRHRCHPRAQNGKYTYVRITL